jgi:hypothetical protein
MIAAPAGAVIQATQEATETGQLQNRVESVFAGFSLFLSVGSPIAASAQNMADYTNYPFF